MPQASASVQLSFCITLQDSNTEGLRPIYRTDSNKFPIIDICGHWLCCIFGSCMTEESCWELMVYCPQLIYNHIRVSSGQCFPEKQSVAYITLQIWAQYMLPDVIRRWWKAVIVQLQIFLIVDNKTQFIAIVNIMLCYTLKKKLLSISNHFIRQYIPAKCVQ